MNVTLKVDMIDTPGFHTLPVNLIIDPVLTP